jgi:hypothetical protein
MAETEMVRVVQMSDNERVAVNTLSTQERKEALVQAGHAKMQNALDEHGYVTLLSEQAPRANESAAQRWGSSTDGTEMFVEKRSDGWYGCMRGIYKGNAFESDDDGPYPSREAAEEAQRDYYADDQEQAENVQNIADLLDYHEA